MLLLDILPWVFDPMLCFCPAFFCFWILCLLFSVFYTTHSLSLNLYFLLMLSWLVKLLNVAWNSNVSHCHCCFFIVSSYFIFYRASISLISRTASAIFPPAITRGLKTDMLGCCCPLSSHYKQNTTASGTQNFVSFSKKASSARMVRKEKSSQNELKIPQPTCLPIQIKK